MLYECIDNECGAANIKAATRDIMQINATFLPLIVIFFVRIRQHRNVTHKAITKYTMLT